MSNTRCMSQHHALLVVTQQPLEAGECTREIVHTVVKLEAGGDCGC